MVAVELCTMIFPIFNVVLGEIRVLVFLSLQQLFARSFSFIFMAFFIEMGHIKSIIATAHLLNDFL